MNSPVDQARRLHRRAWEAPYRGSTAAPPSFFVYDASHELAYRGRMDETRPDQGTPDGKDLRAALDALLAGERPAGDQWPSMGCSIKFRA